jgi:branched-chain amino acid transport system substrate-binding protein
MEPRKSLGLLALSVTMLAGATAVQGAGVTDKEIVIGVHSDLSGPASVWGVPSRNAMQMRFDEVNAAGGIHGRKLRLVVEDSQYQVPRAVQAANKLINRDKVFAILGGMGTPMNNAILPRMIKANIPNLFPFSAARQMTEPHHALKFAHISTYYDHIRAGMAHLAKTAGVKTFCVIYQDSDFGKEILFGAQDQAKKMGLELAARSAHKPTASDFVAAVAKFKKAKCEAIAMGTIIKDTILPFATARKMGFDAIFFSSGAGVASFVAGAKGGITEGLYGLGSVPPVYPDDSRAIVRKWLEDYKAKYGKYPGSPAQLGYIGADLTVMGLDRAGRNLTVEGLVKALESIKGYKDIFGGPVQNFSADNHRGTTASVLYQVKKGRWVKQTGPLAY